MLGTLCTLLTALTCGSAVTVVTQTPAVVTVRKGESATLHCNLGTVTGNGPRWYKQVPGETPQYMLRFHYSYSSAQYGSGFSSPKFDSKSSSETDYSLIINTVEVGDSAVYYCKTYDSGPVAVSQWQCCDCSHTDACCCHGTTVVFGPGTKLIVTDPTPPTPSLTVFPPSSEELQGDSVRVVCVAEDVSAGLADVSWLLGGNPLISGISTSSTQQQPNGRFRLSSILTIQTAVWTSGKDVTCQVTSSGSTASKTISQSDCSD
ncbi:immunoglobulin lambda-1 light chain-like [Engraulis encrasicolus]|uniref:immunoglobulin lambda-1 light chain-like n=1 Tax=Engraulis encrasicolus TaxID=184585 RepID=UPI002FD3C63E